MKFLRSLIAINNDLAVFKNPFASEASDMVESD